MTQKVEIRRREKHGNTHSSTKLEQLSSMAGPNMTATDLTEAYRISGARLFHYHLLDRVFITSVAIAFALCRLVLGSCHSTLFVLVFSGIVYGLNYHIEAYRSFLSVSRNVEMMMASDRMLQRFILSHSESIRPEVPHPKLSGQRDVMDSFQWINKSIVFLWPSLSQLIHSQLDEFFEKEVRSRSMAHDGRRMVRIIYAMLTQFDSRILTIEKFQLGRQSPEIKYLTVKETNSPESMDLTTKRPERIPVQSRSLKRKRKKTSKFLVCDAHINYNGNMNLTMICRNSCCFNSRIGLEDVFLNFKFRVLVGPVSRRFPFIRKLSLTLMEKPDYGYKGIALVELAQLKIARRLINRAIKDHMLYPKMLSIDVAEFLSRSRKKSDRSKPVGTSASQLSTGQPIKETTWFTRCMARILIRGCMCSNWCLRICQTSSD